MKYVAQISGRARTTLLIVNGGNEREALADASRYAELDPVTLLGQLVPLTPAPQDNDGRQEAGRG